MPVYKLKRQVDNIRGQVLSGHQTVTISCSEEVLCELLDDEESCEELFWDADIEVDAFKIDDYDVNPNNIIEVIERDI